MILANYLNAWWKTSVFELCYFTEETRLMLKVSTRSSLEFNKPFSLVSTESSWLKLTLQEKYDYYQYWFKEFLGHTWTACLKNHGSWEKKLR